MKRSFLVIILVCAFVTCQYAAAESAVITGKITDLNGTGIAGVNVSVEGQDVTAKTSKKGTFKLSKVDPGQIYIYCSAPGDKFLDGETRKALAVKADSKLEGVTIVLSGRPGNNADYVGMKECMGCHDASLAKHLDGSTDAAVHSRFVTEGTSHMVYPELWPEPGDKLIPRSSKGEVLKAQDPLDGHGMVNFVLCTKGEGADRDYLFKFYPEQEKVVEVAEADLDCSDKPSDAVWVPVGATIGGEGNWGEGYADPEHKLPDRHPNFGEGKQRYMARIQDIPYLVKWMKENGVDRSGQKQDYVAYMPYFVMQDGTPVGSDVLAKGDLGFPNFWEKSPHHWCTPDNTYSRNCAGCHSNGVSIEIKNFLDDPDPHNKFKAVVVDWDYKELKMTCERCHGPGSDHAAEGDVTKIIAPQYLTVKASSELCGQCHGNHDGRSITPPGIFKPTYNDSLKDGIGNGFFVPGVHELKDFIANFNLPTTSLKPKWKEGSFHSWGDQTHERSHSTELLDFVRSVHYDNPTEKLTCATCHDPHSLDSASLSTGEYEFVNAAYGNNTLCLACHAAMGPFEEVTKADVATLQLDAGRKVTMDGKEVIVSDMDAALARNRVARSVARHMQVGAGMGMALYTPDDTEMPLGNCASCHMAKIGKLQNINVDSMWHLAFDDSGKSAVAEGNIPSHVFDIVWPAQSSVLKKADMTKAHDYDIMPNSCSKCHASSRLSGDND